MSTQRSALIRDMYQRYVNNENPMPATACAILAVGAAMICVGLDVRDAIKKCEIEKQ